MKSVFVRFLLSTGILLFGGIAGLVLAFFINEFKKHQNRGVVWYPDELLSIELGIISYFVFLISAGITAILLAVAVSKKNNSGRSENNSGREMFFLY